MISASGDVGISAMLDFANVCWMGKECWMNGKQLC